MRQEERWKVIRCLRCLCGLAVRHHRGTRNESLSCAEARRRHQRASVVRLSFLALLKNAVQR